jgi:cell division protein FtsW
MEFFRKVDKIFLFTTLILLFVGFLIFSSASMGLLARSGASFSTVALKQILIGFIGGGLAMLILSNVKYNFYKKYSFYFLGIAILMTLAVFVPGLGFSHGGATRWISVLGFSFQPAEILKLAFIIYLAAWLSKNIKRNHTFQSGLVPVAVIFSIVSFVLLIQPDTDTLAVMLAAGTVMYFVSGASKKHIALIFLTGLIGISALAYTRPYIKDRILTLMDPTRDALGSGYQINQSLIAVGSGGFAGRGFGQSVQKFNYLPEPIGDSIFAVAAEEFGFLGSVMLLMLFLALTLRGLYISAHCPDNFSKLLTLGIIILIITQSFVNISAMIGILPLSGIPLVFVSHGGTAMLIALSEIGIILNISKYIRI